LKADEVIAMDDCTEEPDCLKIYKDSGIIFHFVDMNDIKFKSLINENTN
jgi:cystathionine beta-lyase